MRRHIRQPVGAKPLDVAPPSCSLPQSGIEYTAFVTLTELDLSRRRISKPGATIDEKPMSTQTRNSADPPIALAPKEHLVGVSHVNRNRFG